jgi:ADP-heptose:LPS heptosyltransferase
MNDPDKKFRETFHKIGVRQAIVRSPRSSDLLAIHQEDRFLETVNSLPLGVSKGERLVLSRAALASGEDVLERMGVMCGRHRLVLFHPGSGSRHKCGDLVLLAKAIAYCQSKDTIPIIVGGPADDEMVARLHDGCEKKPVIIQRERLLPIAGVLAHASLFVGYDSGLSHLAARFHVPTIVIFGPTDPQRWAPRGTNVTILTGEACRCAGWDVVRSCPDKPCLHISTETLITACEMALASLDMSVMPALDHLVMSRNLC